MTCMNILLRRMTKDVRISQLIGTYFKVKYCLVTGGGGHEGLARRASISRLLSKYFKAEYCVVIGGGVAEGVLRVCEYFTLGEQIFQS